MRPGQKPKLLVFSYKGSYISVAGQASLSQTSSKTLQYFFSHDSALVFILQTTQNRSNVSRPFDSFL